MKFQYKLIAQGLGANEKISERVTIAKQALGIVIEDFKNYKHPSFNQAVLPYLVRTMKKIA